MTRVFYFTVLAAMCFGCSDSKETRMQRFLQLGNESVKAKEYVQAERYYLAALKLDTCYADALNNLGTLYHRSQDETKAIGYYSRAIACSTTFDQAYLNRANLLYEVNRLDEALHDVGVVEKRIDTTAVLHLKGLIFWKKGYYAQAKSNFLRLLDKDTANRDALTNIASLCISLRQYDSARLYLNHVLKLSPDDPDALNTMALLEAESGNLSSAHIYVDRALAKRPDEAYYLNNKGYILLLERKADEALPFLDKSILADPSNGWAYRNKGYYYALTKQYDDALRLFRQAEQLDPFVDKLDYFLGEMYRMKGDRTQSCNHYRKAAGKGDVLPEKVKEWCKR